MIALDKARGAAQLGRPSIDGKRLVYAKATGGVNKILKLHLGSGHKTTLRRSVTDGLSNPSIRGHNLLYVRHERAADRLVVARLGGGGRVLLSRSKGTLWSTALAKDRAYVTIIRGTTPAQRILSVER